VGALKLRGSDSETVQTARSVTAEHSLLTVEEVSDLLKVPVSWVYERTRKRGVDRIPGFRLGKHWRFREADVLAWINRQRVWAQTDA
jgi:excisionase family DNA binding protein